MRVNEYLQTTNHVKPDILLPMNTERLDSSGRRHMEGICSISACLRNYGIADFRSRTFVSISM